MAFRKDKTLVDLGLSGEQAIFNKETEGLSQGQIVFRRFVRHKAAMTSVFVLASLITMVFTALDTKLGPWTIPGWWKHGFDELLDLRTEGCPPGIVGCPTIDAVPSFIDGTGMGLGLHPFGQDDIGHDYFAMVMRGAQRSLYVAFVIGTLAGVIGITVGAISGYFRGWVDSILMRFTDFIITIPSIIIGSVVGYHFGNLGVGFLAFYLGLFAWTGLSRLVRGEFLKLRELEFVDAARVAGAAQNRRPFERYRGGRARHAGQSEHARRRARHEPHRGMGHAGSPPAELPDTFRISLLNFLWSCKSPLLNSPNGGTN